MKSLVKKNYKNNLVFYIKEGTQILIEYKINNNFLKPFYNK